MRHATAEPPDSRIEGLGGQGPRRPGWLFSSEAGALWSRATKVLTYESCSAWPFPRLPGCAYAGCWGLMVVTRVGMGEGHWLKRESGEPQS